MTRGPAADIRIDDRFGRPLRSLRISVTDRCNLRCRYCMPEDEYVWLPRSSLLTFEEIDRLVGVFESLGVDKVRITGGEPLLRQNIVELVRLVAARPATGDLALTTNGVLLSRYAESLQEAGLTRVTVSLDTLKPERFREFAKSARFDDVLRGIDEVRRLGFGGTKVNSVITRGVNDDEIMDLFEFVCDRDAELRYIEYMDVGGATGWSMEQVVSRDDILDRFRSRYGTVAPVTDAANPSAPAERFRLADGRVFGVVASTTAPFCATCDRSRLTADGMFYLCLYADQGLDLRAPLRDGASDNDLAGMIAGAWRQRADRGAEERARMPTRGALYQISGLRTDPHREMHTRGG
jgi:GTP 3',8-cyclase